MAAGIMVTAMVTRMRRAILAVTTMPRTR
jgi:hypothetical protein